MISRQEKMTENARLNHEKEYRAEIEGWDWDNIKNDAMSNDAIMDDFNPDCVYYATFIGSVFSIMPSGKYYMPWCSNQTDKDVAHDLVFQEILDEVAEKHGAWIESGEGDACDLFACFSEQK
jgi:hypothetical protein